MKIKPKRAHALAFLRAKFRGIRKEGKARLF